MSSYRCLAAAGVVASAMRIPAPGSSASSAASPAAVWAPNPAQSIGRPRHNLCWRTRRTCDGQGTSRIQP
eukprot:7387789-Prymnesium_polylepis.1